MSAPAGEVRGPLAFGVALLAFFVLFLPLGWFGAGWVTEWGTGLVIILAYMVLARPWRSANPETQDSIYFLGFLMTLTYLVIGLLGAEEEMTSEWIHAFLSELGIALGFSIMGLGLRQLVTLGPAESTPTAVAPAPAVEFSEASARRVADLFAEALKPVSKRFDESARTGIEALNEGHDKLRKSLDRLQEGATEAAKSLGKASEEIASSAEKASAEARKAIEETNRTITDQLETSSRISRALGKHLEDLEATVRALVNQVQRIGSDVEEAAGKVHRTSEEMAASLEESEKLIAGSVTHTARTWKEQLDDARRDLAQFNRTWREEKVAGLDEVKRLTEELRKLGAAVHASVETIPSPGERVEAIWRTLDEGEERITAASGGMSQALGNLDKEIQALAGRVDASGRSLEGGSERVRKALAEEATEIKRLVDELYGVMESKINTLGRR